MPAHTLLGLGDWQVRAHARTQEHERRAHASMHELVCGANSGTRTQDRLVLTAGDAQTHISLFPRMNAWRTHALQEETAGGRGAYVLRGDGGSSRVGS